MVSDVTWLKKKSTKHWETSITATLKDKISGSIISDSGTTGLFFPQYE